MRSGSGEDPVRLSHSQLAGIRPATVKTFEQAKPDLETEYRRNEAEKLFNNAQDQLADAALQNTTDIDVVARKAGLTVLEVPVFSRIDGGGALSKVRAVIDAAFSQDVLDGRLSPIVEVEKGRGVVLRATDHNCRSRSRWTPCARRWSLRGRSSAARSSPPPRPRMRSSA